MARTVAEIARRLNLLHPYLPALIFMTDEHRLTDPLPAVEKLPRGSAVILRHYNWPERVELAQALARLCHRRSLRLLVAGNSRLARAVGADGVHLPEYMAHRGRNALRRGCRPGWIITTAAHSPAGIARAESAGADAVLLSPIFATPSHPGIQGLGVLRFVKWCRAGKLPIYGLGGIDSLNAQRLVGSGAAGIAGIRGLVI